MSLVTKRALAAALKSEMEKKPFDKITVIDIVTECGVNRQTFYYHFQDVYELLGWIFKTEAVASISEYKTYETWQQGFLMIFNYVSVNKAFCMNCFRSFGREHLDQFLYEITFNLLMGVVKEVSQETQVSEKEKRFIANFYCYAFIGLLTAWMREGMKDDPKEIICELNTLIEGDIQKAINKYI